MAAIIIVIGAGLIWAAEWPDAQKGIKVYSYAEDQVVPKNGTACFTIVIEPEKEKEPLFFRWQKNGSNLAATTNISGVTTPSLVLSNVQIADVGFYTCEVRRGNAGGQSIIVGGTEKDAPGARLFVYTGTNTAGSGPYQPGVGTRTCMGQTFNYIGKTTMKWPPNNSTWVTRPSGKTTGTATETTGLGAPYASTIQVVDNSLWDTCGVSVVTFPAKPYPKKYQFTVYVTAGQPALGTPLTIDLTWSP